MASEASLPQFNPSTDDGQLPTSPGLPYGWTGPTTDEKTGATYYRNHKSGRCQKKAPPPPPSGPRHSAILTSGPKLKSARPRGTSAPVHGAHHRHGAIMTSKVAISLEQKTIQEEPKSLSSTDPNIRAKDSTSKAERLNDTFPGKSRHEKTDSNPITIIQESIKEFNAVHKRSVSEATDAAASPGSPDNVPLPAPTLALPVIVERKVYICKVEPGLGFRSEMKWEARVQGKGVEIGKSVEGEEREKGWLYVPNQDMWLPLTHDGKVLMEQDQTQNNARENLLNDIKRTKGRNIGARSKLLHEITKGKSLKKAQLQDAGVLLLEAANMQEAIVSGLLTYEQAVPLWKFFIQNCGKQAAATAGKKTSTKEEATSAKTQKKDKKKIHIRVFRELVRTMKAQVVPSTKTYVWRKYHNCISGAEVMFYMQESKEAREIGTAEDIGKVLLNANLLVNASNKKLNGLRNLPIKADQYYRYGDVVIAEGELERSHKTMFNHTFRKRFYRLVEVGIGASSKRQEYRLDSYINSHDKTPHSSLDITDAKLDSEPESKIEFTLKTAYRELKLKARDQAVKKEWIEHMKQVLGSSQFLTKPDPTFGSRLSQVTQSEGNKYIPKVVWECVEHIRAHGMKTEGVFRKAGLKERVTEMVNKFDSEIPVVLCPKNDIHNAAACLKQWLRELPEPLVPFQHYKAFLYAQSVEEYKTLVGKIPKQNQQLMAYLCTFLERLSENEDVTRMHTKNLALVFAPNILRPMKEDAMEAFQNSDKKIDSFSRIIENVYPIFGIKPPADKIAYV